MTEEKRESSSGYHYYERKKGRDKGKIFPLLFDSDGERLFIKYNWWVNDNGKGHYSLVRKTTEGKVIKFHREFLNAKKGEEVDHINRNSLDNRKENLRIVTRSQNLLNKSMMSNNTSGHRGVTFIKKRNKWRASLSIEGTQRTLGEFISYDAACQMYEMIAKKLFKDYIGEMKKSI